MQININETFGTVEGFLLTTESETFETYCKKNVNSQDMDRVKQSIENERITVVSQFDPEVGSGEQLMNELKTSSMGTPLMVIVDPFSSPIDGMDQKDFYLAQGFSEVDVYSGQGQVMVLK